MKLHLRIIQARQGKGFTQEQLADLAGVSSRTIQRIESGETIPRSFTLKAIAGALGESFEELVKNDSPGTLNIAQQSAAQSEDDLHFLKMFNLSCFSYLVIPWVHFLVPGHLLKKQNNLQEKTIAFSRKLFRQQVYWLVAFHSLLLLTLAYNIIQVRVWGNRSYVVNYLWPFFLMYLLNGILIATNAVIIRRQYNVLTSSESRMNVV